MRKPLCASWLALRGRVFVWLPGLACPLASPTCLLGAEEGSQVLIPVADVSAAEGQTSPQGALFVFSPIVFSRSYCKGREQEIPFLRGIPLRQ